MQLTRSNKRGSHVGEGEKETAERNVVEKKMEFGCFEDEDLDGGIILKRIL